MSNMGTMADYLPTKKKGIDDELETIKHKQKGVEIAITQAKLEASEAELAALRVTVSAKKKNGRTMAVRRVVPQKRLLLLNIQTFRSS